MKSRLAMMAMLVVGLLMSGTGASLAVTGTGSDDNASQAQYNVPEATPTPAPTPVATPPAVTPPPVAPPVAPPVPTPVAPPESATLPAVESGGSCDENGDGLVSPREAAKNGCGAVKGETEKSTPPRKASKPATKVTPAPRAQGVQPAQQTAASNGDELPFTGFAAVPILLGGIALMAGGLVLRRRTANQ